MIDVEYYLEEPLKKGDSIVVDGSLFGLRKREIALVTQVFPEKGTLKVAFSNGREEVFIEEDIETLEPLLKQPSKELLDRLTQSECWCEQLKTIKAKCPRCRFEETLQ